MKFGKVALFIISLLLVVACTKSYEKPKEIRQEIWDDCLTYAILGYYHTNDGVLVPFDIFSPAYIRIDRLMAKEDLTHAEKSLIKNVSDLYAGKMDFQYPVTEEHITFGREKIDTAMEEIYKLYGKDAIALTDIDMDSLFQDE